MKLGNKGSAAAPGGYTWNEGDVVEVPDAFGRELLLIQGSGFYEVSPAAVAARRVVEVTPEPEPEADDDPHKLEANPANDLSEAIEVANSTKRSKPRTKAV